MTPIEIIYNELVKIFTLNDVAWLMEACQIISFIIVLLLLIFILILPVSIILNFFKIDGINESGATKRRKSKKW